MSCYCLSSFLLPSINVPINVLFLDWCCSKVLWVTCWAPRWHFCPIMHRSTTKPSNQMCLAKTQIIMSIRKNWSASSLCALLVAKGSKRLQADSKDSGKTVCAPRLICLFWVQCDFVGFTDSCLCFPPLSVLHKPLCIPFGVLIPFNSNLILQFLCLDKYFNILLHRSHRPVLENI